MQSDLDLLIAKYYKKRLEFAMKNRETYTINHISTHYLLIKSSKLTKLQKSTNYFFNIKPLPKKSFLFILLFLSLCLSLFLPFTIYFLIPFISSQNFFCPYLEFERKISPYFLIITLLSIDKIELFLKQGRKKKLVS